MTCLELREVFLRQTIADLQVRFLGLEAEVREGVDFRAPVLALVELGLRENVVHLQTTHLAEQARLERQSGSPVLSFSHAGKQAQHRIEPRAEAPPGEVARLGPQPPVPEPQLLQQLVKAAVVAFERGEVLVDEGLGGAGEAPPHGRLYEPEEQLVAFLRTHRAALLRLALVEIAHHHRHAEATKEHLVVVETQPPADEIEARVDVFRRTGERVLYLGGTLLMQVLEPRLPGQHRVHRAQQPVEREVVAGVVPLLEPDLHRVAPFRPLGADLGEGKVALGELGATAVHPVEDVDHHVERLVRAGDFLNVQVHLDDTEQLAQAPDVVADLGR